MEHDAVHELEAVAGGVTSATARVGVDACALWVRRLTVLLRREGWQVNAKRVYRLYDEENLKVRSVERKKISRRQRVAQGPASKPNQCWSADFVSDRLADGRSYRILTIVDQFT